eukprot:CAMPEP_0201969614 /NCGR_PEP_ID=MMETSP0904-20121228/20364_1 /ASSEMBLY_ACC=CAM_ASM_000553 /TAXON_ID=420261 /ORGANISM="Thalassiosira antarctica, Strain CCMP982" /LENGTH=47 /DNA_ID= /DNA_START= /DNA_END= /DNA_ORIENTATION=
MTLSGSRMDGNMDRRLFMTVLSISSSDRFSASMASSPPTHAVSVGMP